MLSIVSVYMLGALLTSVVGIGGGWWLRSRGVQPAEAPVDKEEVRRAQELLGSLRKLASNVARLEMSFESGSVYTRRQKSFPRQTIRYS